MPYSSNEETILLKARQEQSRKNAGFFSRLFFLWLNGLFKLVKEKDTIEAEDLEDPENDHKSSVLCAKLSKSWKDCERMAKRKVRL